MPSAGRVGQHQGRGLAFRPLIGLGRVFSCIRINGIHIRFVVRFARHVVIGERARFDIRLFIRCVANRIERCRFRALVACRSDSIGIRVFGRLLENLFQLLGSLQFILFCFERLGC
ncbi:hypothetical protein D3C73_583100 [compost metagenome]